MYILIKSFIISLFLNYILQSVHMVLVTDKAYKTCKVCAYQPIISTCDKSPYHYSFFVDPSESTCWYLQDVFWVIYRMFIKYKYTFLFSSAGSFIIFSTRLVVNLVATVSYFYSWLTMVIMKYYEEVGKSI